MIQENKPFSDHCKSREQLRLPYQHQCIDLGQVADVHVIDQVHAKS